jgi:hypothetical protein
MKRAITLILSGLVFSCWIGCKPNKQEEIPTPLATELDAKMANDWFTLASDVTKGTPGFTAPVAARSYAYAALTFYEAVVYGMPGYQSMQGHLNGLASNALPRPNSALSYHWGIAANRAMALLFSKLYPNAPADLKAKIGALEDQYQQSYSKTVPSNVADRSIVFGEGIAQGMFDYARTDGQVEAFNSNYPTSYTAPSGPGAWAPTPPLFQPIPLQPYWGKVRPFLSEDVDATQPPAPPDYSKAATSPFYVQALEVYAVGSNLTNEQIKIAEFWNDESGKSGTPAGHSFAIARQVLVHQKASLAKAAEVYAKVGMGVHDAFISCWKAKYQYNLIRPISYIKTQIDPSFAPLIATPPCPEYTCYHAVQMAATAQILTDMFGYDYAFSDQTNAGRTDIDGTPRSFASFLDAAQEAGISRLYCGTSFRAAIESGMDQGVKIGKHVSGVAFKP